MPTAPLAPSATRVLLEHEATRGPMRERAAPEDVRRDREDPNEPVLDALDPVVRSTAQLAPPLSVAAASVHEPGATVARAPVSMEELLSHLVKRIAWAGDKKRGSVRLELGAGPHAGTVVELHAEGGRLRMDLRGEGSDALRSKVEARLARRGLILEERA
jgi:hypothetical protein